ncbi:uncharacterized protein [Nicotiana tomentosiformis]|uniref:uncharacterized protein n=1 Tax=Nicotiana tomentosiformis TaxID=4098 RepID=UPI00388CAED5
MTELKQALPGASNNVNGRGSVAPGAPANQTAQRVPNGHRIRDCRNLCKEIETLLKNSHLREFLSNWAKNNYDRSRGSAEPLKIREEPPRLTINIIFEGNEINSVTFSATKKTKLSVTYSKRLWEVSEDDITFTEEDADGLLLPHNDALVFSLKVLDFKIKRVLVDPGSSANVIQWRVLELASLTGSITLLTKLLTGFNLASVTTGGGGDLATHECRRGHEDYLI